MPSSLNLCKSSILSYCLLIFFLLWLNGCKNADLTKDKSNDNSKITIGIQVSPAMILPMVAKDKGFFAEEGVEVELKEFTAGKFALQAFLSGSIDFAISGEVPVVLATLQGNKIIVLAQVVEETVNEIRVVALKDGDLDSPEKYFSNKKRKLSTSFGGGPEFFTYSFLKHFGISNDSFELLSQKPEDMPAALESKTVSAIAIFDPYAFIAEKRLGDKAITFTVPDIYSELYVLNARSDAIVTKPEVIKAILKALVRAGAYVESNSDEAKQICQKYTKLDREIIDGIWGNFVFKLALTSKLIEYWNAEAKWAIETGKVKEGTEIPDFRKIVDERFIKDVSPESLRLSN